MRCWIPFIAAACIFGCAAPAVAQILNPSFEANVGSPQSWGPSVGTAFAFFIADADMPSDGSRFLQVNSSNLGPATPHSNPGGFGTDATGTAHIEQAFSVPALDMTLLSFDVQFLSTDTNPDFVEVSVSDGTQTKNILHLDTSATGAGPTSNAGFATTVLTHVTEDLGASFPTADLGTVFTITLHAGNAADNAINSIAFFDDFALSTGGTALIMNSFAITLVNGGQTVQFDIVNKGPFRTNVPLLSFDVASPAGSGPLFGLFPTSNTIFLAAGVQFTSDASGMFSRFVPELIFPTGTLFDFTIVAFLGATFDGAAPVQRIAWP